MEFHQAVVSTLRDSDDACAPDPAPLPPNIQHNPLMTHTNEDMARLCETHGDLDTNPAEDDANDNGKWLLSIFAFILNSLRMHALHGYILITDAFVVCSSSTAASDIGASIE